MNEDYTHITFLLDRSGSMGSCWNDVKGGFKTLIGEQKEDKSKCTFSLVFFDNEYNNDNPFVSIQTGCMRGASFLVSGARCMSAKDYKNENSMSISVEAQSLLDS